MKGMIFEEKNEHPQGGQPFSLPEHFFWFEIVSSSFFTYNNVS